MERRGISTRNLPSLPHSNCQKVFTLNPVRVLDVFWCLSYNLLEERFLIPLLSVTEIYEFAGTDQHSGRLIPVLWIRIRKFLGLPDPDPSLFVRIRSGSGSFDYKANKIRKNLVFYCFVTYL